MKSITLAARHLRTRQIAKDLGVHVNTIRLYEANGLLLALPRAPSNQYRLYGTAEFGRVRGTRTLAQPGYSLMAILRMLQQCDAGNTDNLRTALDVPREDEAIQTIADRFDLTGTRTAGAGDDPADCVHERNDTFSIVRCAVLPLKPSNIPSPPYTENEQSCRGCLAACEVV